MEVTMWDRLVEVFCEVDDFCKTFQNKFESHMIGNGQGPRGPIIRDLPRLRSSPCCSCCTVRGSNTGRTFTTVRWVKCSDVIFRGCLARSASLPCSSGL